MRKVRNLDGFELYGVGDRLIFSGKHKRTIAFEVNPVGPVIAYLYKVVGSGKKEEEVRQLIGWTETPETFEVNVEGAVWVQLEPSAEVWVRHATIKVAAPNPSEGQTFTRMERMGVYADDLTVALHRQATLNRIISHRETYQRDAYQRELERRLVEVTTRLDALSTPEGEGDGQQSAAE